MLVKCSDVKPCWKSFLNLPHKFNVKIEFKGEGKLNSISVYSRCQILRFLIGQEDWTNFKKKEKQELETIKDQLNLEEEEEDRGWKYWRRKKSWAGLRRRI